MAGILLTEKGEPRKKLDKRNGFPADKSDIAQSMKKEMQDILDGLNEEVALIESLFDIRNLPNPRLSDEEMDVSGKYASTSP